jgi:hypothetical protein
VKWPTYCSTPIINDQIRMRVYCGGELKLEMPLRQRQALVLAAQILNLALMPEVNAAGSARARYAGSATDCTERARSWLRT